MPSAKYSWSGSRLMFANGSTATDGRSGAGEDGTSSPSTLPASTSNAASPAAISARPHRTAAARAIPSSVGSRPRVARRNSSAPSSSSSARMRWLTALWVTFSSCAALVKLRCRATASKARSEFSAGSRRTATRRRTGASFVIMAQAVPARRSINFSARTISSSNGPHKENSFVPRSQVGARINAVENVDRTVLPCKHGAVWSNSWPSALSSPSLIQPRAARRRAHADGEPAESLPAP